MTESEERGSYERHRPDLPRRYTVSKADGSKVLTLAAPVLDAIDADPGDEVVVRRTDDGEVVLEVDDRDFVPATSLAPWLGCDDE
ncbi:hypothetical protein [Halocalculus aciditolerans]|uniref:Uncharacterized protein n=1 Tax=Halocalculus aciditolerans TaxID=1383812 RepID=A0A830FFS5_9EURY|nr:hypothetical protein [Halocalculus aciditolerans]GGL70227.1 hypothetical protein GCM10009039_30340 [Halocalculus aciditolerans]